MRRKLDLWFKRLPEAAWPYVPQPLKESNFTEVLFFLFTIGSAGAGLTMLAGTAAPKPRQRPDGER